MASVLEPMGTTAAKKKRRRSHRVPKELGMGPLGQLTKQHEMEYKQARNLRDKHKADRNMIRGIARLPGKRTLTEQAVRDIMKTKLGLNI